MWAKYEDMTHHKGQIYCSVENHDGKKGETLI